MANALEKGLALLDGLMISKSAMSQPTKWARPTELPSPLIAVAKFDPLLLPNQFRPWLTDVAYRMQCPLDFLAVGAMVAASSLIGNRAVVQPKEYDTWQVTANLWGMVIGRPGMKKSPALSAAMEPLHQLEKQEHARWADEHQQWQAASKLAELMEEDTAKQVKHVAAKDPIAAQEMLKAAQSPCAPTLRRMVINDTTMEKAGELLKANPGGLLCYRDELYGLLTAMDKPGQEGARAFYLQAYDGDKDYTFDRIVRGTVRVPRACLAMLGAIQPSRLQEYVNSAVAGGRGDDGLLQRFALAVWPDPPTECVYVDAPPDNEARMKAFEVFSRLSLLRCDGDGPAEIWRLSSAAQLEFNTWMAAFERGMMDDCLHPALESHLVKFRKVIPAIALTCEMVDGSSTDHTISRASMVRALSWVDYLRSHAERMYFSVVAEDLPAAQALLRKIKSGQLGTEFTVRQVVKKGWTGLTQTEVVRKAAVVLQEHDWVRAEKRDSGGRPSEAFVINPLAPNTHSGA